ncbi:MAG: 2-dehydropantoate 2-reductase [Victivallales bacterium]|jgi:2-dehydropantoate 2-reductase|nr:2-dehydropantoate 2-reductase [Victivallales bacterium]
MCKVLVIGAGAVGVYFSGRLAQAGAEVSVVARSDYEAASQKGYEIKSIAGDFHFIPKNVLKSAADYENEADFVILSSKVLPGADSVELLRPAIHSSKSTIVLIQNGIDIEKNVASAFSDNELISAIAYIGVSRPQKAVVLHQGGGTLKLGRYPTGVGESARYLASLFAKAKVECELCEDVIFTRWNKLLWNLPFNSVSVLAGGATTKDMTRSDELEELCRTLMDEVIAVANACGVALTQEHAEAQMEYTRNFPAYKSSMLQDFEAGRELEVEAILGNTLRLAAEHDIYVPHMATCYALLKGYHNPVFRGSPKA